MGNPKDFGQLKYVETRAVLYLLDIIVIHLL